jgi:tetratricopeptide (TPR) repeat protein
VAAYGVHSVFDFNLHVPANTLCLAFVFGILATPRIRRSERLPRSTYAARLAAPALAIWLVLAGLPTLWGEYWAREARIGLRDLQLKRVIETTSKGLEHDPRNFLLYYYSGHAKSLMAEFGPRMFEGEPPSPEEAERYRLSAIHDFQAGLALFPQDAALLVGLGQALDDLKRHEEAEPFFKSALRADPNNPIMSFHYAAHLHTRGRLEEAEAEYRRSLAIGPNKAARAGLDALSKALNDQRAEDGDAAGNDSREE